VLVVFVVADGCGVGGIGCGVVGVDVSIVGGDGIGGICDRVYGCGGCPSVATS